MDKPASSVCRTESNLQRFNLTLNLTSTKCPLMCFLLQSVDFSPPQTNLVHAMVHPCVEFFCGSLERSLFVTLPPCGNIGGQTNNSGVKQWGFSAQVGIDPSFPPSSLFCSQWEFFFKKKTVVLSVSCPAWCYRGSRILDLSSWRNKLFWHAPLKKDK